MKVQRYAFFGELKEKLSHIKEVPFFMKFSMIALAVFCLGGGLLLVNVVYVDFLSSARDVVLAGKDYITVVFGALR